MLEETVASAVHSWIWASLTSWFTPTLLFLFLNIMIGAIAITSSLASQKAIDHEDHQHQHHKQQQQPEQQLWRSPSMLQRLGSINLYSHRSEEPQVRVATPAEEERQQPVPSLSRSPSVLQRLKSFNPYNYLQPPSNHMTTGEQQIEEEEAAETLDEIYSKLGSSNKLVGRSKSDTKPVGGEVPKKLAKKMRKSASARSAFAHFEQEQEQEQVVEARRPATVREGKSKSKKLMSAEGGEGEDSGVDAKADDFINKFKQQLKLQRIDSIIRYKEMVGSTGN